MFTFCDVLHEPKQKHQQTLENAQRGLEISFKAVMNIEITCLNPCKNAGILSIKTRSSKKLKTALF